MDVAYTPLFATFERTGTNNATQNNQNNDSHLKRLSQSILPSNTNSTTSSTATTTQRTSKHLSITHQRTPSPSSPLIHNLSTLSLHSNPQGPEPPPPPPSPSADHHQHHGSDSNSTSTSHHGPPSLTHPHSSAEDHKHTTSDDLFSEQEPNHVDYPHHTTLSHPQQQASEPITNDIASLALSARITEVAMSIQEVALALFQVQELRHSSASNQSESKRHSSAQTSPSILAADRPSGSALTQVDKALMRLDKKVETTIVEIMELEKLIAPYRTQEGTTGTPQSTLVNDKFDHILEEWDRIQHDTEVLKDELKEDKWLVVFRAVSGQAEEMMESLEKVLAVSEEFIRETHRRTHHYPHKNSPPAPSHTPLKLNVRKNRGSHASSVSSGDRQESEELLKSYHSLIKNFHAKNKHYVPSCERVLGILSKGIKSRSTKNGEVLRRFADMNLRFSNIQQTINRVGLDLLAVEKILQQACVSYTESIPADCSIQASDQSLLQPPPPDLQVPTTPTSSQQPSKTRKALTSMSNYLISTSPQFLSKQSSGLSNSVSPFRKLASKFAASATPSVSSQPSSVGSGSAHLLSGAAAGHSPNGATTSNTTRPAQHRSLRPIRSTLNMGPSPSSSSSAIYQMMSKSGKMATPSQFHASHDERRTTASGLPPDSQRPRPASRQQQQQQQQQLQQQQLQQHQRTLSHEKPRWNISLKRIEDSPVSLSGSNLAKSSSRRVTMTAGGGTPSVSRSQSRTALRNSGTYAHHHHVHHSQYGGMNGTGGGGYERPGSAAGRSEASCGTTLSMSIYRSRPPSRHSRIPAPLWDPAMESQRHQSKGSMDLADLVRPHSRAGGGGVHSRVPRPATALSSAMSTGLMSPTESDMAKMPGRPPTTLGLRSSSRAEQRLSTGSLAGGGGCQAQLSKVVLRRLDSPLSRNPEKARLAGAGIGDQARYAFWFVGCLRPHEEKSVMCKLVEPRRPVSASSKIIPPPIDNILPGKPELKVLVRTKAGWKDLDLYLLDGQQPPFSSL
ncbi:hypothetical protein PCANC_06464 [Puccinia coronata f. sp. avenae]|uniref:GAR domain-containing protein n=1 Tax=Puccinia coronata f. sp. avenae TaxID=200324 RepID=A0A2N5VVZ2_9BASI|nr:hypothetical protein PCANC_06464 [Puccinia coronata f. sp. avenae]